MRKRNKNLNIRLTEEEWRYVKLKQAESEMNMRDFFLTCVYCQPMIIKKGADKIVTQLKYIGNNLNQLTRKVNSGRIKDCSFELEKIYMALEAMREEWQ